MRKQQIILSFTVTVCGKIDSVRIESFDEPSEAKKHIEEFLADERKEISANAAELNPSAVPLEGNILDLWKNKEGCLHYEIADRGYFIAYRSLSGEYGVSDDEVVEALDAFVNSSRNYLDYEKVAGKISQTMHRYCQNELWKFIKKLIRAIAAGRADERNCTAQNQAADLAAYMDSNNI